MNEKEKYELIQSIHNCWRIGDLRYKMHDGQLQIHEVLRNLDDSIRIRMLECCRGYGKTTLNVLMACEDCARPHPQNYPIRIIGPEKDQTIKIVEQVFDVIASESPQGWIRQKGSIWYVGKNRIEIDGFNRGSIERLRGKRAAKIYLEEIRDVPSEDLEYGLKSILLPMSLRARCPVTAASTSSRQKLHAMNTYFRKVAQENAGYFHFSIYECPIYSEADIAQAIKDCRGEDTEDFKTEYLCEAVDTKAKIAVPSFDEKRHVVEFDFPRYDFKRWVVTDVGGLRDPTHSICMFFDERVNKVRVKDERVFNPQTPTSSMVAEWRDFEEVCGINSEDEEKPFFLDAPGQFLVDLREEHLFHCSSVQKGGFEETVKVLDQAFYDEILEIHPDCVQLIHQLNTGKLNKKHDDFERESAIEDFIAHHCDGIAALMYGWRMRDIAKIRKMPSINSDTQWIHPKVLKKMREEFSDDKLELLRPRMRRFR